MVAVGDELSLPIDSNPLMIEPADPAVVAFGREIVPVPIKRFVPPASRERVMVLEIVMAGPPGKRVVPSMLKPVEAAVSVWPLMTISVLSRTRLAGWRDVGMREVVMSGPVLERTVLATNEVGASGMKTWLAEVTAALSGMAMPTKEIVETSTTGEDVLREVWILEMLDIGTLERTVLPAMMGSVRVEVKTWPFEVMADDEEACGNLRVGVLVVVVEGFRETAVSGTVTAGAKLDKD